MKTIELINFNEHLFRLSVRQFSGKLSYAIYKNLKKIEPIVKKYYEDLEALAKAYKIEVVDGKYTFEGESQKEFEVLLNEEHTIELHKVDELLIEESNLSVNEIMGLEPMINVNQ
jgi:meiotically up-regulated gene 157 (Mug157) protein